MDIFAYLNKIDEFKLKFKADELKKYENERFILPKSIFREKLNDKQTNIHINITTSNKKDYKKIFKKLKLLSGISCNKIQKINWQSAG